MEPAAKRLKVGQAPYDDDDEANDDELSLTASQFAERQDPMYQLDKSRAKAAFKLKSRFEDIFAKYGRDFEGEGDEIDLYTGEIIVNNGHIQSLEDEKEREAQLEQEEEERILQGKPLPSMAVVRAPSTHRLQTEHRLSGFASAPPFMGAPNQFHFGSPLFGNAPLDPAWQTPEIRTPAMQNQFRFRSQTFGYPYLAPGVYGSPMGLESHGQGGGFLGGLYNYQSTRKIRSAREVEPKGLPAPSIISEENEGEQVEFEEAGSQDNEEEDDDNLDEDALLGISKEDELGTQDASEDHTRQSSPNTAQEVLQEVPEVPAGPPDTTKKTDGIRRRRGRPSKKSSVESVQAPDEDPRHPAGEVVATEPDTVVLTTESSDAAGEGTSSQTQTSNASSKGHRSTKTQKQPIASASQTNDERNESHGRRSCRTRKQPELYGQVLWAKQRQKKAIVDVSESAPNHTDKLPEPTSESTESDTRGEVHSQETDCNATQESDVGQGGPEIQQAHSPADIKELLPKDSLLCIAPEMNQPETPDVVVIAEDDMTDHCEPAENHNGVVVDDQDHGNFPTSDEIPESRNAVVHPAAEVFVRNQLDPSYAFSDEEDNDCQPRGDANVSKTSKLEAWKSSESDAPVVATDGDPGPTSEPEAITEVEIQASVQTPALESPSQSADVPSQSKAPETESHGSVAPSPTAVPEPQQEHDDQDEPELMALEERVPEIPISSPLPEPVEKLPTPPPPPSDTTSKSNHNRHPQTPQKASPRHSVSRRTSSYKKSALASLIPDHSDDEDEISILPSYTPTSSFKAAQSTRTASRTRSSTPRRSRKHSLLVSGTPIRRPGWPATEIKASSRRTSTGLSYSSLLARTALERVLLRTPQKRKPDSPAESLFRTPGGTVRRCGEDGFVCDRDFCFTCCK